MTIISVEAMFALAMIAGTIEPRPVESWTMEPVTCQEEPTPYGKPKWAWQDAEQNPIEWCQSI